MPDSDRRRPAVPSDELRRQLRERDEECYACAAQCCTRAAWHERGDPCTHAAAAGRRNLCCCCSRDQRRRRALESLVLAMRRSLIGR